MRTEINELIREGLANEGVLTGPAQEINTLVSLGRTASERGNIRYWQPDEVALFHNDLKHYRVKAGDACEVTKIEPDRVHLKHPDGTVRHLKPDGDIRYRVDICKTKTILLQAGDRIRWTRNDKIRNLLSGDGATVVSIDNQKAGFALDDGRQITLPLDDIQMKKLDHAYASTVHGAQGQTRERVIAVLDSGDGPLTNQQTFYVEISRARDDAVILTDDREQLIENLMENTGKELTAIEAVFGLEHSQPRVPEPVPIPPGVVSEFLKERRTAAAAACRADKIRRASAIFA